MVDFDWVVVGAGFTGSVIAERLANDLNQKVLVVDKRFHIGGNAYDEYNESGVLTHVYGPHIFHTNSKKVWDYLSQFTEWRPYMHEVRAIVDGIEIPLPFNINSLEMVFPSQMAKSLTDKLIKTYGYSTKVPILKLKESEDNDLKMLAEYVFNKVFLNYTVKQWGMRPEELSPSVTARVPIYISRDNRYFQDTYQGLPLHGYEKMFKRLLDSKNIKLMLNTDYSEIKESFQGKKIVYTGQIDEYYDYIHGELPYRSLVFKHKTFRIKKFQNVGTVNYPENEDFTRITEQKKLTGQDIDNLTSVVYEYPIEHKNGMTVPYYPIPTDVNRKLYSEYEKLSKCQNNIYFAGRLGNYMYYNMDQAVANALSTYESIKNGI